MLWPPERTKRVYFCKLIFFCFLGRLWSLLHQLFPAQHGSGIHHLHLEDSHGENICWGQTVREGGGVLLPRLCPSRQPCRDLFFRPRVSATGCPYDAFKSPGWFCRYNACKKSINLANIANLFYLITWRFYNIDIKEVGAHLRLCERICTFIFSNIYI